LSLNKLLSKPDKKTGTTKNIVNACLFFSTSIFYSSRPKNESYKSINLISLFGISKRGWGIMMGNRKIYAFLVSAIVISAITPLVMAATEDNVHITFDPDGQIDIDVSPASYAFGSAVAGIWTNSSGSYFTLYNNGTVPMDTQIKSNATTDETTMTLNTAGNPGLDEYSFNTSGFSNSYGTESDTSLNPSASQGFDICLLLGTSLSANHTTQNTTIYFQGSIS